MGRSKFPGKPTKLVNKKRISVLSSSSSSSSSSSQSSEQLSVNTNDDDFDTNDSSSASSSASHSPLINSSEQSLLWNANSALGQQQREEAIAQHNSSGLLAVQIQQTSTSSLFSPATISSSGAAGKTTKSNLLREADLQSTFNNDGDDNIQVNTV